MSRTRTGGAARPSGAGRSGRVDHRRGERGSATAELAVALPALVLLLVFSLGAVDAVIARMRCVDAARDGALSAARGGDGVAAGRDRAPSGASVSVIRDGERVRARVSVTVRPLGPHLPGIPVAAEAVADAEPAASP
jgi:TadE-like protein